MALNAVTHPGRLDMIMRLRSRGISNNSVLKAMELVPRHAFVTPEIRALAYAEQDLPIACGQTLSAPLTVALMTQILEVERSHTVLEIGMGSGYHSAILSKIAEQVFTVERYKSLISEAEDRLKNLGLFNISSRHGDGRYGWSGDGNFDRILVTCGMLAAPDTLLDQLAVDGVLLAVIDGSLTRFRKARKRVTEEVLLPLNLSMIEAGKSKAL